MSETAVDLVADVPERFTLLNELDSVFRSPSIAGELVVGPDGWLETLTAVGALTNLINAAARATKSADLAMSWRNYNVGSTSMMVNFGTGMMGYFSGYNVKPQTGKQGLNIHAEQMAISKGRRQKLNRVIGISVVANPNDDDANPAGRATLPVCSRCVEMFMTIPEVDENTLVLGMSPDADICELYPVASLVKPGEVAPLTDIPFSLQTEKDLTHYDREIVPFLVQKVIDMYRPGQP